MRYMLVAALAILAGCGSRGAVLSPSATAALTASPMASTDLEVQPVSLSDTSGMAAEGLRLCNVAAYADHVAGVGIVAHGTLVKEYVALSGKEPELMSDSPAFVVQYSGTIRETVIGVSGGWVDIQDAICVMINGTPYPYDTGAWVDSSGQRGSPEPGPFVTKDLPTPLP